jgi:hypothetical protein
MKNKEEIEKQRKEIRSALENIAKASEVINKIMKEIPHKRGIIYRSLKPKSGEYITHMDNLIHADFIDSEDNLYEIQIKKYNNKD